MSAASNEVRSCHCGCAFSLITHKLAKRDGLWIWKCDDCGSPCEILAPLVREKSIEDYMVGLDPSGDENKGVVIHAHRAGDSLYFDDYHEPSASARAAMAQHPSRQMYPITGINDDQWEDAESGSPEQHLAVSGLSLETRNRHHRSVRRLHSKRAKSLRLRSLFAKRLRTLVRR